MKSLHRLTASSWMRSRCGSYQSRAHSNPPGLKPGTSCISLKPAIRSRGLATKRSHASRSLIFAASRNLSPQLHEGDVAPGEFDFERSAVLRCAAADAGMDGLRLERQAGGL